ncbi:hypothetical protein HAX54_051779 [Datura stramonium]|uniref:protein-serine/threonine phosphatase n=1 Tax=Datura stramonium TaxID=4076 RepID=A0ABS8WMX2_DATST|nr:hypothetical protein [Datura stramonium]
MSLTADSPVHSSSSDDFAAFLDAELDSASDASPDRDEILAGTKKRKVELVEAVGRSTEFSVSRENQQTRASLPLDVCKHPGVMGGMCIRCGQKVEDESGVAFGYIHKNLRLADDEVARLRDKDLKNLLRHKKLYLVLDLDHTLLNSTRLPDISPEESYLKDQREVSAMAWKSVGDIGRWREIGRDEVNGDLCLTGGELKGIEEGKFTWLPSASGV